MNIRHAAQPASSPLIRGGPGLIGSRRVKVTEFHVRLVAGVKGEWINFGTVADDAVSDFILAAVSVTADEAVALIVEVSPARRKSESTHDLASAATEIMRLYAETLRVVLKCPPECTEWVTQDRLGHYSALFSTDGEGAFGIATAVPLASLMSSDHRAGCRFHEVYPEAAGYLSWRVEAMETARHEKGSDSPAGPP